MIMPMPIQSQFYPNNANGFSTGGSIDFNFNSLQKHHHHHQQQQGPVDPNVLVHYSNSLPSLQKEWQEIDQFIGYQHEQMRLMVQAKGNQYMEAMLKDMKSQSALILKKKDEEIAQATNKRLELEHFIRKLEAENWIWKKEAQDKEAMAVALYTALEEQKKIIAYSQSHGFVANAADAESHWDETNGENEEKGEEGGTEVAQTQSTRKDGVMLCKSCHSSRSTFLFLPCRHLASCKSCDAVLKACPVCGMQKKSSIETLNF